MPRRKVPDNVKELRGTKQPCRSTGDGWVEFEELTEAPDPPQYLEIEARQYWERIVPIMLAKKVLTIADLEAVEVMCVLYGKVRKMATAGVDISSALVTQLRLYQTEFGLTPHSRNRVAAGDATPKGNKFAGNGRRKSS
jgi:phage terminase small subunit